MREFFDEMMDLGVEGMMLSPGYCYAKAPDQEHFLRRQKTHELFADAGEPREALEVQPVAAVSAVPHGQMGLRVHAVGHPAYNIFGWQRPCYLLQEGYAASFKDLMEKTAWENYGHKSGNEKCKDCMVHCGYEATAVDFTFASFKGLKAAAQATLTGKL